MTTRTPPFCGSCGMMIDEPGFCDVACEHDHAVANRANMTLRRGMGMMIDSLGIDFKLHLGNNTPVPINEKDMECSTCGTKVVQLQGGAVAHVGGGPETLRCTHCGWIGGGAFSPTVCPCCGDSTSLTHDHTASVRM